VVTKLAGLDKHGPQLSPPLRPPLDSVEVLDTTLRDGAQAAGVSFTLQAKVRIALELDELGVAFIEGGWPGSNPKDELFFREIKDYSLRNAAIVAFTATRRKNTRVDRDNSLVKIIEAEVDWATVFGKSWLLHVTQVLRTSPEENLSMIADTVEYLREHGMNVIFDAEHYFDGYIDNPEYAVEVLRAAVSAGASRIVLADTNGGMLPHMAYSIVRDTLRQLPGVRLGVHMHNDSGNAVANTLMGVLAGASHVQVTVNGIGERTGNADLCQVVPALELKMGVRALANPKGLRRLTHLSRLVYELAGISPNPYQPYVGDNAFTHKAGVHVDAVLKTPRAYEHIAPDAVGNTRKVTVSELSGTANLAAWTMTELGLSIGKRHPALKRALGRIKDLENKGYRFDTAKASALLILLEELGLYKRKLSVQAWRIVSEGGRGAQPRSWALVRLEVEGAGTISAGEGGGPVHAIDKAVRRALVETKPHMAEKLKLIDYRVELPGPSRDTASVVRVEVTMTDGQKTWTTVGVSDNIVEASLQALIDAIEYKQALEAIKNTMLKDTQLPSAPPTGPMSHGDSSSSHPYSRG